MTMIFISEKYLYATGKICFLHIQLKRAYKYYRYVSIGMLEHFDKTLLRDS